MNINSDLESVAFARRKGASWTRSPQPGVDRIMLDRIGGETASRATTIVRYQADSSFPAHTHTGGEEFLVLSGVFSDSSGNFPEGFYVRNPIGSRHTPFSRTGAEIYVKLGQIDPADQAYVRLDTKGSDWQSTREPGVKTQELHRFRSERVRLVSLEPGQGFIESEFANGLEILVVSGDMVLSGQRFDKHDWIRTPQESGLEITSTKGGIFLLKTGHLPGAKS
jgi:anti-sigma factor ChrR (cupin superfamily)